MIEGQAAVGRLTLSSLSSLDSSEGTRGGSNLHQSIAVVKKLLPFLAFSLSSDRGPSLLTGREMDKER